MSNKDQEFKRDMDKLAEKWRKEKLQFIILLSTGKNQGMQFRGSSKKLGELFVRGIAEVIRQTPEEELE